MARRYHARLACIAATFALLVLHAVPNASAQDAPGAPVSISEISGNLYLVKSGSSATVFLVADNGILLVDPLSLQTAQFLKGELSKRYPDRPIRYVVLTSHRFDRASGAGEFKDTAEVIAHDRFSSELSQSTQSFTSILAPLDANHDGRLSASEVEGTSVAEAVLSKDRNGDGWVTPDELYRNVQPPTSLFARSQELRLGSESIRLVYAPLTGEQDAVAVYFPAERLVFASVVPAIVPLPAPFGLNNPRDLDRWFKQLRELAFDRLISGSGDEFTQEQIAAAASDLSREYDSVTAAVRAGQPLQQTLAAAGPLSQADRRIRDEQVASLYHSLWRVTTSLYGVAGVHMNSEATGTFCDKYVTCKTATGPLGVEGGGANVMFGRFGVDVSVGFRPQYTIEREAPLYGEIIAYRDTAGSALGRYAARPWLSIVGGLTTVWSDGAGVSIVKAVDVGTSGRAPISRQSAEMGFTFGMDYSFGWGGRLLVPLRATYFGAGTDGTVSTASVGGLAVNLTARNRSEWQFDVGIGVVVIRSTRVVR